MKDIILLLAFFIHKYNPEISTIQELNSKNRKLIGRKVDIYSKICQENLSTFLPTLFLTSIYNRSLFEAFLALVMRVSQFEGPKNGLNSLDLQTWKLQCNILEINLFFIEDKAKGEKNDLRKKWLKIILLDYKLTEEDRVMYVTIDYISFQINESSKNYPLNFVKTIWLLVDIIPQFLFSHTKPILLCRINHINYSFRTF